MKAKYILKWICRESIDGELLNLIDVPDEGDEEWEQNEGWWINHFGNTPPKPIPEGTYMFYYLSALPATVNFGDAQIEIPTDDGFDYIILYKVED